LRRRAGLTQGELAALVGFSGAQISRLEQNERLPTLAVLAEKFVPALGLQAEPRLVERLLTLAAEARGERPPTNIQVKRSVQATIQEEVYDNASLLPSAPTTLVGRQKILAMIGKRLLEAPGRLVTLVGPPGVGKTRLALAVATQSQALFADGARFVALAAIRDSELVAGAILSALGLSESSPKPPAQRLVEALRRRTLLLVLDNFEQVYAAAPLVASLLEQCAGLRVLVTSRTPLRLRAEQRVKVQPLEPAAAVELFLQRAQAINPDFATTSANASNVAEICLQLDCLPLAIELVAARSELFSLRQLLGQLERGRLNLLEAGVRDLPERHQSLRNAIVWSYRLLDTGAQRLFAQASIFAGGFRYEALQAVATPSPQSEASADEAVMAKLQALLEQSLVQQEPGEPAIHFTMLETIRSFALEQLAEQGEEPMVRRRHADYFLLLASNRHATQEGQSWREALGREQDNLRSALAWLLDHDAAAALLLANRLADFWHIQGYHVEGRRWLERALAVNLAPNAQRGAALLALGKLAHEQSDYPVAQRALDESLSIYQSLEQPAGMAEVLQQYGWLVYDLHDVARAQAIFQQSLALFRAQEDQLQVANVLVALAHLPNQQAASLAAHDAYLAESLAIYRQLGHTSGIANVLHRQGMSLSMAGDYGRAVARLREALAIHTEAGARRDMAWALEALGEAEWLQRELVPARDHLSAARQLFDEMGDTWGLALTLHHLAQIERVEGHLAQARQRYAQSLRLFQTLKNRHMIARCLAGLGGVALGEQDARHAARYLAAADAILTTLPPFLAPGDAAEYEGMIEQVCRQFGSDTWTQMLTANASLVLDELVTLAGDMVDAPPDRP
jgi:predicted ATPase/transcriptional regulator with XRE-family HTH domain